MSRLPESLLARGPISALTVGKIFLDESFDARLPGDLEKLSRWLGMTSPLRQAEQIHTDLIDLDGSLTACDAFLVRPGQAALVRHADCFPVIVAAPQAGLAIVAHCGWKGVALDLVGKSARQLLAMGCRPEELCAAIGPGIGPASFEVGPEVLGKFPTAFHSHTRWGTASVDLPAVLRRQGMEAGIAPDRIEASVIDTFADPKFHSYRREKELSGRNATVCIVSTSPS